MTEVADIVDGGREVVTEKLPLLGVRHAQVVLLFLLLSIGIGMRVQISVAIVAMTTNGTSSNPDVPTFYWTNKGLVLSSFYWGYLSLQLVAGVLGKVYGSKIILAGAMGFSSTASLATPVMAERLGSYGVMICRTLQGVSQGFFLPSVYNLLGDWIPLEERSRLSNVALLGTSFGNIISGTIVGYICSTSLGWPFSFYLFGALGYVWVVLWIFYGASRPAEHKSILENERMFIVANLPETKEVKLRNIPWKSIFTSVPVWAIIIISTGVNWGGTTLSTELATYMDKIMKYDIKSNGLISTVASVSTFLTSFVFAYLADYLVNKKILSVGATRKLFTTIGSIFPGASFVVLGFLPQDAGLFSVVTLMVNGIFQGALHGGVAVNHMDLSPRYVGIVMAASNSISNGVAMLAPVAVQFIVTDEYDRSQWRTVFLVSAAVSIVCMLVYVVFGSGEIQEWNSFGDEIDEGKRNYADVEKERKISRKVSMIMST